LEVAVEQPHIYRLTRLGAAADEAGKGIDFIYEVSQIVWDGTVKGWNVGDHLTRAATRAGLDLAELDAVISRDPGRYDRVIEANQAALEKAGHWGVPTMAFEGEPFFGQDRIELLLWRLKRRGLARR
jgi:2-hydroxychromene-2-carboxylate isomerase